MKLWDIPGDVAFTVAELEQCTAICNINTIEEQIT